MATANKTPLTKAEIKILIAGLNLLHKQRERNARAESDPEVAHLLTRRAAEVSALQNRLASGELEI